MAGVNRANVAVTDTFDTWRLRTNEINTTLNEATQAKTANNTSKAPPEHRQLKAARQQPGKPD